MTDSFSSQNQEQLIAGYVLGELDPEETEQLKQLIAQNPELLKEVVRMQEVMALIAYELPPVQPPTKLRSQILAAVQSDQQTIPSKKRFSIPWGKLVAAIVILILAIDNYRLRQELQRTHSQLTSQQQILTALQQPNSRLVTLKAVNTSKASGSIIFLPNQGKLVVALENLSRLPENQIYRLWAVIDGKKIACAQFNANLKGKVLGSLVITSKDCSLQQAKLVVTQEPFPSPQQPVGSPVLIGEPNQKS
jgi:anti-sigma-K factor RskA